MKPLLAHTYEPHRVTYPCYVQPKLNGIRALYQAGRFQSRDELPFPEELLSHLSVPLHKVFEDSIILDGELYVHGWPLQRILSAVTPVATQRGPTEDTLKVEYHVFDVVDFNESFRKRMEEHCVAPLEAPIKWVRIGLVNNETEANNFYAQVVASGYEGMMYRLGDCPYTRPKQTKDGYHTQIGSKGTHFLSDKNNRTWHLLKRKDWQDSEFEILSINQTRGDLGQLGFQLWCIAANGARFAFGSGLTNAEVEHYLVNPPIGRKVKGKYLVLSDKGIPQNATILTIL